jgi:hypothetical protein
VPLCFFDRPRSHARPFSFYGTISRPILTFVAELFLTLIPGHGRIEFCKYANICTAYLFGIAKELKKKAMRFGGQTAD